jgi:hypothetical protein
MIVGGVHTVSATATQITDIPTPCRVLTVRMYTGTSDIEFGGEGFGAGGNPCGFLQADESWTWGPNAGTIDPANIYVKGTAGDKLYWCGVPV